MAAAAWAGPEPRVIEVVLSPGLDVSTIDVNRSPTSASGRTLLVVCCGANPMLIRQAAEAVGLTVPASRYREDMSTHFMYGTNERIPKHMKDYGDKA